MKQLHIFSTTGFVDCFVQLLERFDCCDDYDVVQINRASFYEKKTIKDLNGEDIPGGMPDLYAYSKVFVHLLTPTVCEWIAKHPQVRFTWVLYGADVYANPLVKTPYLLPRSRAFEKRNPQGLARKAAYFLLKSRVWKQALRQVDIVLTSTREEFEAVRLLIDIPTAQWGRFYYGKALLDCEKVEGIHSAQGPIQMMLGNNATSSLNHADFLFDQPEQVDRIHWHIPLSYGDKKYRTWLQSEVGHRSDVTFHLKHRPIEEYTAWINGLHGAVFHNLRPQGLANFHSHILMGKAIFLHRKNTIRDHYTGQDLFVPPSDSFQQHAHQVSERLPWEGNKRALQSFWNMADCKANYQEHFS